MKKFFFSNLALSLDVWGFEKEERLSSSFKNKIKRIIEPFKRVEPPLKGIKIEK